MPMSRLQLLLMVIVALSSTARAQTKAIEAYLREDIDAEAVAKAAPGARDPKGIQNLLPQRKPNSFVEYLKVKVKAKSGAAGFSALLDSLDSLRLNKLIGNTAGGSGTTSLVSRVAVPAILGFGVEYGSIVQ